MEEYEIKKFEKAPYLELENYKAPIGKNFIYSSFITLINF